MIKWKTNNYILSIEAVEIVKETAHFITRESRWAHGSMAAIREKKDSPAFAYFDTWEDAHSFLMTSQKVRIENAEAALSRVKTEYEELAAMTRPDDA